MTVRAYLPDAMLSPEKKEKPLGYIKDKFSSGCDAIYYSALFSEFEEDFRGERIYTPEMLKTYLRTSTKEILCFSAATLPRTTPVQMNPEDEIREYLKEAGGPVEVKQALGGSLVYS